MLSEKEFLVVICEGDKCSFERRWALTEQEVLEAIASEYGYHDRDIHFVRKITGYEVKELLRKRKLYPWYGIYEIKRKWVGSENRIGKLTVFVFEVLKVPIL